LRLSLAIATKGRPDDLRETLESLSGCDPKPHELIVVDGDEGRSAEPVVAAFAESVGDLSVRYEHSAPGSSLQRNIALDLMTGDVVVFVDDDVRFQPEMFERLARAYEDTEVVGATGHVIEPTARRFGQNRSRIRSLLFRGEEGTMTRFGYPRRIQDVDKPRDVEFMQGCLMSARADLAREVRLDEQLPGYALAEDEDFAYRLSRRGRVRYLPDVWIDHKNLGGGSGAASRAFNRKVVVNRAYLFRKNFRRTPLARLQFGLFVLVLAAHRAVNMEWQGLRGLVDGSIEAWRRPL
jgi:GT2 family glycosyltransferase